MSQTPAIDPNWKHDLDQLPTASVDTARHQLSISPIPKLPMIILQKLQPVSVLIRYEDFLRYRDTHNLIVEVLGCLNQLPDQRLNHPEYTRTYELCRALEKNLSEPPCFAKKNK